MFEVDPTTVKWLIGQVFVAAAIWGGMRADIRNIHSRLDHIERATSFAHSRLDNHLERRHNVE